MRIAFVLCSFVRCACVLCALLFAGGVAAQPREVSAEDRATARSLMDDGDAKFAAGEFAGALEAYKGADAIMGVPTTAIEVAKTQAKLGMLIEAGDTLNRVLRFPVSADEPEPFVKARKHARALVAEVGKRTPSIRVVVRGAPKGVRLDVSVDGTPLREETIALPRKVNPGEHTVRASAGDRGAVESVQVKEGEIRDVVLELAQGVDAGVAPKPAPTPPAAETTEPSISPLVWVGFGVGAAGLIAGGVTGGLALSRESDLATSCPDQKCAPGAHDDLDDSLTLAHVSTAMFAIGGAGIALGIVGLALSDFDGEESAVVPLVGPTSIGVRGRF